MISFIEMVFIVPEVIVLRRKEKELEEAKRAAERRRAEEQRAAWERALNTTSCCPMAGDGGGGGQQMSFWQATACTRKYTNLPWLSGVASLNDTVLPQRRAHQDNVSVPCTTAGQLLRARGFAHIDALHLDVEGAEFGVLASMLESGECSMDQEGMALMQKWYEREKQDRSLPPGAAAAGSSSSSGGSSSSRTEGPPRRSRSRSRPRTG